MQSRLEHEVGLESSRAEAVALRSRCRQLESESLFADVFDKYEQEIQQLQVLLVLRSLLTRLSCPTSSCTAFN